MSWRSIHVVLLLGLLGLAGCASDKCEGLAAQARIAILLAGLSEGDVSRTEVTLRINGGSPLTRGFPSATPSFVFEFGDTNIAPRSLDVLVKAFDASNAVVGSGALSTTFAPNGCNNLTVEVRPGAGSDGGPAPDGGVADAAPPGDALAADGPLLCGNGNIDPGEVCDGTKLNNNTCVNQAFEGGTLACTSNCLSFDTTACYKCGDGLVNGPAEVCDGTNLNSMTCVTQSFDGGTLTCNTGCATFNTTACYKCGDGQITPPFEECDGPFPDYDCTTFGFAAGGSLACTNTCKISKAGCSTAGFVTAPKGTFLMGSPNGEPCPDPDPMEAQHSVTLTRAFELQSTEVTQAQFSGLMGYNPSPVVCNNCPVENVTWHEAVAYCNALSADPQKNLAACYTCTSSGTTSVSCSETTAYSGQKIYDCPGYRLPTEAEWERAYRANTTTGYYNGDPLACFTQDTNLDVIAWYDFNSGYVANPVAQKAANAWGLFDMAGNAWEWCHDRFAGTLGISPATDPWGAASGTTRVMRSSSYRDPAAFARAAHRSSIDPTSRDDGYGFRCARSK